MPRSSLSGIDIGETFKVFFSEFYAITGGFSVYVWQRSQIGAFVRYRGI